MDYSSFSPPYTTRSLTFKEGAATAAAAKSLQSCPTLCDPTDGSPPGSPIPGILQARVLELAAIAFSERRRLEISKCPPVHIQPAVTPSARQTPQTPRAVHAHCIQRFTCPEATEPSPDCKPPPPLLCATRTHPHLSWLPGTRPSSSVQCQLLRETLLTQIITPSSLALCPAHKFLGRSCFIYKNVS